LGNSNTSILLLYHVFWKSQVKNHEFQKILAFGQEAYKVCFGLLGKGMVFDSGIKVPGTLNRTLNL
jgi:hypothetical protein